MACQYKDGWHTIRGYIVLVKNGQIIRGVKADRNKSLVPAYPYRKTRDGGYDLCSSVNVNTFRRHPDRYFMF
jgi:hypothetical protein